MGNASATRIWSTMTSEGERARQDGQGNGELAADGSRETTLSERRLPVTGQPLIKTTQLYVLDPPDVMRSMESRGRHGDSELAKVLEGARRMGFAELGDGAGGEDRYWGWQTTYTPRSPVEPPADIAALSNERLPAAEELTGQVLVRGAGSTGGDQAAVLDVNISAGPYIKESTLLLRCPGGNCDQITEHAVNGDTNELELVDGWWDRFRNCLGGCGGPCLAALGTCIGTGAIPAILACLAIRCGGCAAKCAACATCDCTWWCKWAAGCCEG